MSSLYGAAWEKPVSSLGAAWEKPQALPVWEGNNEEPLGDKVQDGHLHLFK